MADISMCLDSGCPSRLRCYRHAESGTVPSERQSYAGFSSDGQTRCEEFMPVRAAEVRPLALAPGESVYGGPPPSRTRRR